MEARLFAEARTREIPFALKIMSSDDIWPDENFAKTNCTASRYAKFGVKYVLFLFLSFPSHFHDHKAPLKLQMLYFQLYQTGSTPAWWKLTSGHNSPRQRCGFYYVHTHTYISISIYVCVDSLLYLYIWKLRKFRRIFIKAFKTSFSLWTSIDWPEGKQNFLFAFSWRIIAIYKGREKCLGIYSCCTINTNRLNDRGEKDDRELERGDELQLFHLYQYLVMLIWFGGIQMQCIWTFEERKK